VHVVVTRPVAQAAPWVHKLRAQGVDAVALPLIEIVPPADAAPVQAAWRSLAQQAVVFFVSANAVEHFFARRPPGAGWPPATRAAAPGPGTAEALRAAGVPAAAVVEPAADAPSFDSEALWARLRGETWAGRSVLVVRGEAGRDWLADQWRSAGATVSYLDAYARRPPTPDAAGRDLLQAAQAAPGAYLWLFSSSEAVRHLLALLQGAPPSGSRALATHPRIAAAARAAGFTDVLECGATEAAVLQAIRGASIQSATS
jgi:uroporphyrinogen-III synthase